jgi:hypothetical protein
MILSNTSMIFVRWWNCSLRLGGIIDELSAPSKIRRLLIFLAGVYSARRKKSAADTTSIKGRMALLTCTGLTYPLCLSASYATQAVLKQQSSRRRQTLGPPLLIDISEQIGERGGLRR